MRHAWQIPGLLAMLLVGGCGPLEVTSAAVPSPPTQASASESGNSTSLQEQFKARICAGDANCTLQDIRDPSLDYGQWLATALHSAALASLPSERAFFVQAGPSRDGSSASLGAVDYAKPHGEQLQAVLAQLDSIPESTFHDRMVVMRFAVQVTDAHLRVMFTDTLDPRVEAFMREFSAK